MEDQRARNGFAAIMGHVAVSHASSSLGKQVSALVPVWTALAQVFMVSSKKIQERNYETLFRWLTQSNKVNIIGRVVLSVPPMWQVSSSQHLSTHWRGHFLQPQLPPDILSCAIIPVFCLKSPNQL